MLQKNLKRTILRKFPGYCMVVLVNATLIALQHANKLIGATILFPGHPYIYGLCYCKPIIIVYSKITVYYQYTIICVLVLM